MSTKRTKWTQEEGIDFIQYLEEFLLPNYHAGMFGSVLHKGHSTKDLDCFIFPHNANHHDFDEIRDCLEEAGLLLLVDRDEVLASWAKRGIDEKKYVEVWCTPNGRRIDVLYWEPQYG